MVNVKAEVDIEVRNVAAQLVVQMIRIRDVSGSNIGLRVGYPEFVSRFSSVQANAGQYTNSVAVTSIFLLSSLLLSVHTTRRCTV